MSLLPSDPISAGLSSAKTIAIAVVVSAVIGTIGYLGYTKSLLETKVADDALVIYQYKEANLACVHTAIDVNKKIEQLAKDTQEREIASAKEVEATKKQAASLADTIKTLQSIKPKGDDCAATKSFASRYFRGLK